MNKILIFITLIGLFTILSISATQATTIGDILVGSSNDTIGLNQVNLGWGGWGPSTTISGVPCRSFDTTSAPHACQITVSTAAPAGGTIEVTMYNTGGAPTTVSGYFSFNQGGSWQDSQLQQVTIPVGVWTTVNFEVCSSAVYEALTTFQGGVTGIDATGTLGDGLQMWLQFGDGSGGGPPAPSTLAVSEIKSVTNKLWTLQVTGQPFDTYSNGGFQLWDLTGWSALTTAAGVQCRATLGTASPTINPMVLTMDPDLKRMLVAYYDGAVSSGFDIWENYADGGSWQDLKIGTCPMTNTGTWRTVQLDLTAMSAALSGLPASADRFTDPSPDFGGLGRPGIQAQFQPWNAGSGSFTQQIPFAMVGVDDQPVGSALPVGWPPMNLTIGNIMVGQNDTTGSNQINVAWGGWSASTTVSGVSCRVFNDDALPTAAEISLSTASPCGGTIQVTMYNYGSTPTTVSAYFNYSDGGCSGTWQSQRLQTVTIPVGAWTTVNFAVSSTGIYEACTTFAAEGGSGGKVDSTNTLADGLQQWLQFGSVNGAHPPLTIAVSEIKSIANKQWMFQIGDGAGSDLSRQGGFYLWDTVQAGSWSDYTTIAGVKCRVTLGLTTTGGGNPTIDPIVATVDPDLQRMIVTYYDNDPSQTTGFDIGADFATGGSWDTLNIGTCPLTGSGGWKTVQLNLAGLTYCLATMTFGAYTVADARYPDAYCPTSGIPGFQVRLRPWNKGADGGSFTQQIPIASIYMDDQAYVPPLSVSPTVANLRPLGSWMFTAFDGTPPYTWSLSTTVMGSLDTTGGSSVTFTAANTTGTLQVTVTDNVSATASATIDITPTAVGLFNEPQTIWIHQSKPVYELME